MIQLVCNELLKGNRSLIVSGHVAPTPLEAPLSSRLELCQATPNQLEQRVKGTKRIMSYQCIASNRIGLASEFLALCYGPNQCTCFSVLLLGV